MERKQEIALRDCGYNLGGKLQIGGCGVVVVLDDSYLCVMIHSCTVFSTQRIAAVLACINISFCCVCVMRLWVYSD